MNHIHELQRYQRWLYRALFLFGAMTLFSGCQQIPRAPIAPPHWRSAPTSDPFLNSPAQPLQPVPEPFGPPQPVPSRQPTLVPTPDNSFPNGGFPNESPQPTFGDSLSAPTPVETNRPVPIPFDLPYENSLLEPNDSNIEMFSNSAPNPDVQPPRLVAPSIAPENVTVPPTLKLNAEAPDTNLLGEISVFKITVQNTGDQAAWDVVIESRFEEGLTFPGSMDRQVNQTLGRLDSGESREIKLSLKSEKTGHHCVEFRLLARDADPINKKVCVEYRDASVSIEAQGPAKRLSGGSAEWNLTVLSRDFLPITGAVVEVEYDSTYLKPLGGSEGAKQELGKIVWNLGMLKASERVELQVEFECLMPVDSTCLSCKVSADGHAPQTVQSCVAIDRALGALDVDLKDSPDPVKIGGEIEYLITITNRDFRSVHDLQVTATLPSTVRAMATDVRRARQVLPNVRAKMDGLAMRLDAVDVLGPNETLEYRIKVKGLNAGTERLLLSVSSDDGNAGKIRLEEVSTVVQ